MEQIRYNGTIYFQDTNGFFYDANKMPVSDQLGYEIYLNRVSSYPLLQKQYRTDLAPKTITVKAYQKPTAQNTVLTQTLLKSINGGLTDAEVQNAINSILGKHGNEFIKSVGITTTATGVEQLVAGVNSVAKLSETGIGAKLIGPKLAQGLTSVVGVIGGGAVSTGGAVAGSTALAITPIGWFILGGVVLSAGWITLAPKLIGRTGTYIIGFQKADGKIQEIPVIDFDDETFIHLNSTLKFNYNDTIFKVSWKEKNSVRDGILSAVSKVKGLNISTTYLNEWLSYAYNSGSNKVQKNTVREIINFYLTYTGIADEMIKATGLQKSYLSYGGTGRKNKIDDFKFKEMVNEISGLTLSDDDLQTPETIGNETTTTNGQTQKSGISTVLLFSLLGGFIFKNYTSQQN